MKTIHMVIAMGKAIDVFSEVNAKNQSTLCGLGVKPNGLAEDEWWGHGNTLCPECHKKSREKKMDAREQKFYVVGVKEKPVEVKEVA